MPCTTIPAAVFLPPAREQLPELSDWLPNDKHRVLDFLAPDSPRAIAQARPAAAW